MPSYIYLPLQVFLRCHYFNMCTLTNSFTVVLHYLSSMPYTPSAYYFLTYNIIYLLHFTGIFCLFTKGFKFHKIGTVCPFWLLYLLYLEHSRHSIILVEGRPGGADAVEHRSRNTCFGDSHSSFRHALNQCNLFKL